MITITPLKLYYKSVETIEITSTQLNNSKLIRLVYEEFEDEKNYDGKLATISQVKGKIGKEKQKNEEEKGTSLPVIFQNNDETDWE